jgi:hypothetical protein
MQSCNKSLVPYCRDPLICIISFCTWIYSIPKKIASYFSGNTEFPIYFKQLVLYCCRKLRQPLFYALSARFRLLCSLPYSSLYWDHFHHNLTRVKFLKFRFQNRPILNGTLKCKKSKINLIQICQVRNEYNISG